LLSNRRTPVRGTTLINLDSSLTGLQNSPTIFGTSLTSDLEAYPAEEAGCTLLQYVDDPLAAANHRGQSSYSFFYGKLGTKYPERRLRSAKTKSNIWGSTSPRPVEPQCRKKTSCLLDLNSDYKKTDM
jgi:hypothetical protein